MINIPITQATSSQVHPDAPIPDTAQTPFPDILTAKELASIFHISRSGAYNLLNSSNFPTLHVGSRKMVLRDDLWAWMRRNTNTSV